MSVARFLLGSGWMIPWYAAVHLLGVLPALIFLMFVRRSRRFGMGQGALLSFVVAYNLLAIVSTVNSLLFAASLQVHTWNVYLLCLGMVITLLVAFYFGIRECLMRDWLERGIVVFSVHAMILGLLAFNFTSLWMFQNRNTVAKEPLPAYIALSAR